MTFVLAKSSWERRIPDAVWIFISAAAVNASAFAVLMMASRTLSLPAFAQLSNAMGLIVVGAALLDAGLNTTATKFHAAGQNATAIETMVFAKMMLLACAIPAIVLAALGLIPPLWAACAVAAASANLWGGWRARDIARSDVATLRTSSLKLALARMSLGIPAILTGSWLAVCVALWIAPVLLLAPRRTSRPPVAEAMRGLREMAGYALKVHLSGVAFSALAFAPQIFINERFGQAEVATYGLVLIVIGPLSLIGASLRSYLLPRVSAGGLGAGSLGIQMLSILGLCGAAAIGLASAALSWLYAATLPQIGAVFAVTSSCHVLTMALGLYNMRVHRLGVPQIELAVNIARLIASMGGIAAFGGSLLSITIISGGVLVGGEICLSMFLRRAGR